MATPGDNWVRPASKKLGPGKKLILGAAAVMVIVLAAIAGGSGGGRPNAAQPGAATPAVVIDGSQAVYDRIAAESNCAALQAEFDQAAENNEAAQPGTDAHRWSLGYMRAADERMKSLGCY